jgi:hypothetical protein
MTINVWENMTKAVTSKEDVGMTATAMCRADVFIRLMATGNEFMPRRRSFMHRLHHRASVSFSHPFFFISKGIASRRLPIVPVELIWTVACNAARYE